MIVVILILVLGKGVRKGKELKAPHYANTAIYNYIITQIGRASCRERVSPRV